MDRRSRETVHCSSTRIRRISARSTRLCERLGTELRQVLQYVRHRSTADRRRSKNLGLVQNVSTTEFVYRRWRLEFRRIYMESADKQRRSQLHGSGRSQFQRAE